MNIESVTGISATIRPLLSLECWTLDVRLGGRGTDVERAAEARLTAAAPRVSTVDGVRTDRLLHLGIGLLALSLLMALGLSGSRPDDPAVRALLSWLETLLLVLGVGLLVAHVVVRALTPPVTIEEVVQDWYDES
jgi:hypothetical protein